MAKNSKKKKGSILNTIIILVCLAAIAVSGYYIYDYLNVRHEADVEYKQMKGKSYKSLVKKNSDIVGWIEQKKTKISYPVMYTPNEDQFYLHRNFDKEYSISGALFVDDRCNPRNGNHQLIFGHHMGDGSMFGSLVNYSQDGYYDKHKSFRYTFIDKKGTGKTYVYKVFSYFKTETYAKPDYMEYATLLSKDKFDEYVKFVKDKSEKKIKITPKWGDDLITLSTCSYHVARPYGRYIVVAVKDKEIKPKTEKIVHESEDATYLDVILDNQLYLTIAIASASLIVILILIKLIKILVRLNREDKEDDNDENTEQE